MRQAGVGSRPEGDHLSNHAALSITFPQGECLTDAQVDLARVEKKLDQVLVDAIYLYLQRLQLLAVRFSAIKGFRLHGYPRQSQARKLGSGTGLQPAEAPRR